MLSQLPDLMPACHSPDAPHACQVHQRLKVLALLQAQPVRVLANVLAHQDGVLGQRSTQGGNGLLQRDALAVQELCRQA